jgi:hypothetical protein
MDDLIKLSKFIRSLFAKEKEKIGLPFFYGFPNNSCEGSSCLLAWILIEKFPGLSVEVIHGKDKESESHFWVEVDGLIFDITIDQFPEFSEPIYGYSNHPMVNQYTEIKRYFALEFLYKYINYSANIEDVNQAYNYVNNALTKYV